MSHNEPDPVQSVRKHRPAVIAIILALAVVIIAYFVFTPGLNEQNDGIATTPPPGDTTLAPAEGLEPDATDPISAEDAAPVGEPARTTAPAGN